MKKVLSSLCAVWCVLQVAAGGTEPLPFAPGPEWRVFFSNRLDGETASRIDPALDTLTLDDGTAIAARPVVLEDGRIDLNTVLGSRQPPGQLAAMAAGFTVERAGTVRIGAGCDWWFSCYVNGELVYSTMASGNDDYPITPDDHVFEAPVRAGVNAVVLLVKSGTASWQVACAPTELAADSVRGRIADRMTERLRLRQLAAARAEVESGPWLAAPEPGTMSVGFITAGKVPAGIDYRVAGSEKWTRKWDAEGGMARQTRSIHLVRLTDLKENTRYQYRIVMADPESNREVIDPAIREFTSFTADALDYRFLAFSDTQFSPWTRVKMLRRALALDAAAGAAFFVSLGDVADGFDDFRMAYFDSFLDVLNMAEPARPFIPVRGNHELRGREADMWFDCFGKSYGLFRQGEVCFLVLDSGEDKPAQPLTRHHTGMTVDWPGYFAEQQAWLAEAVRSPIFTDAKFRVVLCHAAPYSHNGAYMMNQVRRLIGRCFTGPEPQFRIHLWLSGHVHEYRRTMPGTSRIVAAKSPGALDGEGADYPFTIVTNDGPGGGRDMTVLAVAVSGGMLKVEALELDGEVLDSFAVDANGGVVESHSAPELKIYDGATGEAAGT